MIFVTREDLKKMHMDVIEHEHLKDDLAMAKVMINTIHRPEKISSKNLEVIPGTVLDDIKNKMLEHKRNNSFNPWQAYMYSRGIDIPTEGIKPIAKSENTDGLRDCPIVDETHELRKRKDYSSMFNNKRYFDEIKDILQITEMSIEHSSEYCGERVRIEGFVSREDRLKKKKQETTTFPKPVGIIRRGKATIVTWEDKTKTTIVLEDKQEDLDIFHTFCIAFTKKMLGSTTAILDTIEKNDTDTIERKKKEAREVAEKKNKEIAKTCKELSDHIRFEKAVQEKMLEQRVYDEAIRRIIAKADKKFEQMSECVIEGFDEGSIDHEAMREAMKNGIRATEALRAVANAGQVEE